MNPLNPEDAALLAAVVRGEFTLRSFRNGDLRGLLYPCRARSSKADIRRQSGAITRKIRLLRAHALIRKMPRTHRYMIGDSDRVAVTALLAARKADTDTLAKAG